jgi:pimeloyl-ACP methyl ester carboxylesterase
MPHKIRSKDGTELAVTSGGQGPSLVIVGGALNDQRTMGPFRAALEPHFTLVTYDRRGRGGSGDTQPYAPEREIEDLAAVIAHAGDAFLFGHSSGAILSLRAVIAGVAVRKLVVNEPPLIIPGTRAIPDARAIAAKLRALIANGDRDGALAVFFTEDVGLPAAAVNAMKGSPPWQHMLELAHTTVYDTEVAGDSAIPDAALRALRVPTLVLHGTASFEWIGQTARRVAELIPDAAYQELDKQQHSIAPDVLAPVLTAFLR